MTTRYVLIVILIAMVAILGAIALNGIFEAWETGQAVNLRGNLIGMAYEESRGLLATFGRVTA